MELEIVKQLVIIRLPDLAKIIKNTVGENFEIIVINPAKYNQLYSKFKNLNDLLAWSHLKAIENLSNDSKCNEVIIDQFSSKVSEMNKKLFSSKIKVLQTPKAERFTAVAAASILARDKFNNWFKFNPCERIKVEKRRFNYCSNSSIKYSQIIWRAKN
jgi:ribonuclease HIII